MNQNSVKESLVSNIEEEAIVPNGFQSPNNEEQKEMENLTINWKPPVKNDVKIDDNNNNNNLNCINNEEVQSNDIRQNLTKSLVEYIENNPLIECPNCFSLYEYAGPGEDAIPEKIPQNAQEYYNKYRLRCRGCDLDFCSHCKESPYHSEFTCSEFEIRKKAYKCRYCREPVPSVTKKDLDAAKANRHRSPDYCSDCAEHAENSYPGYFPCGHPYGFHNNMKNVFDRSIVFKENKVPCIHPLCAKKISDTDLCSICYEELAAQPWMINPSCGHILHYNCIKQRFERKWGNEPINFKFSMCPLCDVKLSYFDREMTSFQNLKKDLVKRITVLLKMDDKFHYQLQTDQLILAEGLPKYNFYICNTCHSPYFGGKRECGVDLNVDAKKLICMGCSGCAKHGPEFTQYKCRFCCSPAVYFCFGHTHFCENCHAQPFERVGGDFNQFISTDLPVCPGPSQCPLGVEHPPNGQEFPLGCTACNEEKRAANAVDSNNNAQNASN